MEVMGEVERMDLIKCLINAKAGGLRRIEDPWEHRYQVKDCV